MGKSRAFVAVMAAGISLAWLLPAQAQFWDWGNRPQRQQQQQYNNNNNWFGGGGGWFGNDRRYDQRQEREAPVDYSRAPASTQKKPEATTPIVVVGDANADWLAYGLEDAFAEKPEINILRKHRTDSGLIRYDTRRDIEWPQVAREIIAADKPKFIIMMIGNNDRQTIREKAPVVAVARPAAPAAPKAGAQPPAQPNAPAAATTPPAPPADPEQQPREPVEDRRLQATVGAARIVGAVAQHAVMRRHERDRGVHRDDEQHRERARGVEAGIPIHTRRISACSTSRPPSMWNSRYARAQSSAAGKLRAGQVLAFRFGPDGGEVRLDGETAPLPAAHDLARAYLEFHMLGGLIADAARRA